nr:hypothetical protein GCM10020092_061980 [Actinoplanes digitatis]
MTLPGRVLAEVGLPAPLLTPEQAALFTVDRARPRHGKPAVAVTDSPGATGVCGRVARKRDRPVDIRAFQA